MATRPEFSKEAIDLFRMLVWLYIDKQFGKDFNRPRYAS